MARAGRLVASCGSDVPQLQDVAKLNGRGGPALGSTDPGAGSGEPTASEGARTRLRSERQIPTERSASSGVHSASAGCGPDVLFPWARGRARRAHTLRRWRSVTSALDTFPLLSPDSGQPRTPRVGCGPGLTVRALLGGIFARKTTAAPGVPARRRVWTTGGAETAEDLMSRQASRGRRPTPPWKRLARPAAETGWRSGGAWSAGGTHGAGLTEAAGGRIWRGSCETRRP